MKQGSPLTQVRDGELCEFAFIIIFKLDVDD